MEPHIGRGGWTWYTGSSGWMYRLIAESLLGLRLEKDRLYIEPCIPSDWVSYKIHYRFRETIYHITVTQLFEGYTKLSIAVDEVEHQDKFIHLVNDRKEHYAEVKILLTVFT
jgi:cellobiose phosphorylase